MNLNLFKYNLNDKEKYLEQIFKNIQYIFLVIGIPAFIITIIRSFNFGFDTLNTLQLTVLFALFIQVIFVRKIKFKIRVRLFFGIIFLFGLLGLASWGLIGEGILYILTSIILVALFGDLKYTTIFFVFATISILTIGIFYSHEILTVNKDLNSIQTNLLSWIDALGGFVVIGIGIIYIFIQIKNNWIKSTIELEAKTDELDFIINNSPNIVFWIDENLSFKFLNQTVLNYNTDITDLKQINNFFSLFFYSEELNIKLKEFFNSEKTIIEFKSNIHNKNKIYYFETSLYKLIDKKSSNIIYQGIARDITESIQSKLDMIEKDVKYQQLTEQLPEIIYECDINGNITFANKIAFEKFGFTLEDLKKGLNIFNLIDKDYIDIAKNSIKNILGGKPTEKKEYYLVTNKNTKFPAQAISAPIFKNNKIIGVRGLIIDITERKKAMEKIIELNAQLEERVKFRTVQLEEAFEELRINNESLLETRKELELSLDREKELNVLKSRFIAMVSHEYRTPLTVIQNSAYILKELSKRQEFDSMNKQYSMILNSVKQMTELLDDVITLNNNQSSILKPNYTKINLVFLISEIVNEVSFNLKYKRDLIINSKTDEIIIETDSDFLQSIIINILNNSLKFSSDKIIINIEYSEFQHLINLSIQDFGPGISIEEQKHIFEPFYKTHKNLGKTKGTGLGLSIVQQLCDVLGYNINVKSKENEGSTFIITIPDNNYDETSKT